MGNIKIYTALILGLCTFLAACSGQVYSNINCSEIDLAAAGQADAMSGKADHSELIAANCGADTNEYSSAYSKGVTTFCSQTVPFDYGFSGGDYENICDSEFVKDYALGRALFDTKHQIWIHESKIAQLKRIQSLEPRMAARDQYQRKIRVEQASINSIRMEQIALRKTAVEKGFVEEVKFFK